MMPSLILLLAAADGKVLDRGKHIVVRRNEGGTWKLHRDIRNTSVPPAGP